MFDKLTNRQMELLKEGIKIKDFSRKALQGKLNVCSSAISQLQQAIYRKVGVDNAAGLAILYMETLTEKAIADSSIYCLGCAKGETWVWPPKSSIVGQAAVHSSGMICVPNTIRMKLKGDS